MSSSDNNITYKKTSFLSGINSEFINQFYSDYLSDPSSLPVGWKKFFEGLSEDEKLVLNDLPAGIVTAPSNLPKDAVAVEEPLTFPPNSVFKDWSIDIATASSLPLLICILSLASARLAKAHF